MVSSIASCLAIWMITTREKSLNCVRKALFTVILIHAVKNTTIAASIYAFGATCCWFFFSSSLSAISLLVSIVFSTFTASQGVKEGQLEIPMWNRISLPPIIRQPIHDGNTTKRADSAGCFGRFIGAPKDLKSKLTFSMYTFPRSEEDNMVRSCFKLNHFRLELFKRFCKNGLQVWAFFVKVAKLSYNVPCFRILDYLSLVILISTLLYSYEARMMIVLFK